MTLRTLLPAALLALNILSTAQASSMLPDGVYQATEGVVVVTSQGNTFTVTDPEVPSLQIVANTSGACSLMMSGAVLPCTAQISQEFVVVHIPALQTTIPMSFIGTVEQYLAAQQAPAPAQHYNNSSDVELPAITYDGMGNMDGTVTISDGGMSYDY